MEERGGGCVGESASGGGLHGGQFVRVNFIRPLFFIFRCDSGGWEVGLLSVAASFFL